MTLVVLIAAFAVFVFGLVMVLGFGSFLAGVADLACRATGPRLSLAPSEPSPTSDAPARGFAALRAYDRPRREMR